MNTDRRLRYANTVVIALLCSTAAGAAGLESYVMTIAGERNGNPGCGTSSLPPGHATLFGVSAGVYVPNPGIAPCGLAGAIDRQTAVAAPLGDTSSLNTAFASNTFQGEASVVANYGRLDAGAHAALSGGINPYTYAGAEGYGVATDTLTITSPAALAGTAGSIVLSFDVVGALSATGGSTADVGVWYQHGLDIPRPLVHSQVTNATSMPSAIVGSGNDLGGFTLAPGSVAIDAELDTLALSFLFGTPFDFVLGLQAFVQPGPNAVLDVDFLSAGVRMSGIRVRDAGGNLVEFSIGSGSGTHYGPNGVIPEPATTLLLGTGLVAIALRRRSGRRALGIAAAVLLLVSEGARAESHAQNLSFNAVNRNPWTGGSAFTLEDTIDEFQLELSVDIPATGLNATDLIAEFLDLDVSLFSAKFGGNASARAGVQFDYLVSGGLLNISYPGSSVLNVETLPGTSAITAGSPISFGGVFAPGLSRQFVPTTVELPQIAGLGYAEASVPGFSLLGGFQNPTFATTFPDASFSAKAFYEAKLSGYVEAQVAEVFGECIGCIRRDFDIDVPYREIPLVEVDRDHIYVNGLGNVNFNQQIDITPVTSLSVSPPDLNVSGSLLAGTTTIAGAGSDAMLEIYGSIDDFIPVVGPFLDGGVGPIGYTLLSTNGGPSFDLYQEFSFEAKPRVTLEFSELVKVGDQWTRIADFDLGESIEFTTALSTRDQLRIQPTYHLDNVFSNETGVSLNAQFEIDGPTLRSAAGNVGPVGHDERKFEIARFAFFDEQFALDLGTIRAEEIVLDKVLGAGTIEDALSGLTLYSAALSSDGTSFDMLFEDAASGIRYGVEGVQGELLTLGQVGQGASFLQTILETTEDVYLETGSGVFSLGSAFCLSCFDLSAAFGAASPFFEDGGEKLYLTELSAFPSAACEDCDLRLDSQTLFATGAAPRITLGDPYEVPVPEPGTLSLLGCGLFGLHRLGRRSA